MNSDKKISDLKLCLIGLFLGFFLGLILLRGFIFSKGLAFWLDLGWEYSSNIYPTYYVWNEGIQNPVIINHLLGKSWLYFFPPEIAERLVFIVIFMIMGLSMFYSTYKLTLDSKRSNIIPLFSSLISTIFFIVNPIVVMRLGHWLLLWYYAFLPLLFYFSYKSFRKITSVTKSEFFKMSVYISLILFLMSPSIRMPYYFLVFLLAFIAGLSYPYLSYLKKSFLLIISTIVMYILLSFVWILPLVLGSSSKPSGYVITSEIIDLLSRNSGIINVLSLRSFWATNWFEEVFTLSGDLSLIWAVFLISIPAFAFASLLQRKNRIALFVGGFSLVILFLAKGSHPPFENFYSWLALDSPIASSFGWQFRGANKWNLLLMFSYSILIGFTTSTLLAKVQRMNKLNFLRKSCFGIIIVILIIIPLLSAYPMLTGDVSGKMKPNELPDEYIEMYEWLDQQNSEFKIAMYPYPPVWGTPKPTIRSDTYWNFIKSKLLDNSSATSGKLLSILNVKYLIVRKDVLQSEEGNLIISRLLGQKDLRLIKTFGFLEVFENKNYITEVYIPTQGIVSTGLNELISLNSLDSFISTNSSLLAIDQSTSNLNRKYVLDSGNIIFNKDTYNLVSLFFDEQYVANLFEFINHHNPSKIWSKASTSDPLHGEWHNYLDGKNIENWDFDYNSGLVFTWASSILEEPHLLKKEDLLITYNFEDSLTGWDINAPNIQKMFLTNISHHDNHSVAIELNASAGGWKTLSSPLIPVNYESRYKFEFYAKGKDTYKLHAKVVEYDETKEIIDAQYMCSIGSGDFDWKKVSFNFIPSSFDSKYMQLQIWHGHETNLTLPNKIWIDDIKVYNLSDYLKPNSLDMPFNVKKDGSYELFIRYFKNQDGGKIGLHLDGDLLDIIETEDQLNKFTWNHLKALDLTQGNHTLTLGNIGGFNAVNIFALIPSIEYKNIEKEMYNLLKDKRVIYLFEAETDLYRNNTEVLNVGGEASNGKVLPLQADSKIWRNIDILRNGNYTIALRLNGFASLKIDNKTFTINSTDLDFVYLDLYLEQGEHRMELLPEQYQPITWNFDESENDFEEWRENTPENLIYSMTLDKEKETNSLKAELFNTTWGWKLINSPLIPINSSKEEYLLKFNIKGENAHAVHAKIIEYNQSEKLIQATRLGSIGDGTFDWKNVSFKFNPPSENTSLLQLQIWHGHNTSKPFPNILWLDNVKIYGYVPSQVDVLWIYPSKENKTIDSLFAPQESPAKIITYEKINPTKYILTINATAPFMISFAESYDPLWAAYISSIEYQPIPLYSVINGFWINKTGNLEIIIRYKPQDWFETGYLISIIALIGCTGYLFYDWKKNNERIKMIKRKIYTILKKKK